MATPKKKSSWAERVEVAVERTTGSGLFEIDDRLRAETVESLSGHQLAKAHITVRTDHMFTEADAQARYHSDRRVVIRTKEAVLFDGYPMIGRVAWDGPHGTVSRRSPNREMRLILEHIVGRTGRDVDAQIIGRHVRDARIEDGLSSDPETWKGASTLATGLPCVFNLDGIPNCDPEPIKVEDEAGNIRRIHLFAYESRNDAIPWTYAKAVRYLLHFYARNSPINPQDVLRQTEALAEKSPEGRKALQTSNDLAYSLLARPDTLAAEATSLFEALTLVTAAAGVHFALESRPIGAGVQTYWRLWTPRSGTIRDLRLTAGHGPDGQPDNVTAATPATEIFETNNISASQISWDARGIVSAVIVVGDVKMHEIQAELLPGWLPEAGLDNVNIPDRAHAKATALSDEQILTLGAAADDDPWHRKYHRNGVEFPAHWKVGRLWVLNETGEYSNSAYARNAPFDSYSPFDFSKISSESWMRRRRRILAADRPPDRKKSVVVEISFDAGTSWGVIESGYSLLTDEAAIWFDAENPLAIAPANSSEMNLWYALVDQTCRVRVRAMIESDQRLIVRQSASASPSLRKNSMISYSPRRFQFIRHLGEEESPWKNNEGESRNRDDSELMQTKAKGLMETAGVRLISGRVVIPWLDTDYRIGDRIAGVRGRGLHLNADRSPSRRFACVTGKRYHLGPNQFETELLLSPADESAPAGVEA